MISKSWYNTLTLMFSLELFGYCHNLQLLFWNFSRKISVDKNLLYGKLPKYFSIYLLEYGLLYLVVNLFAMFSKFDGVFHWNGTSICVFTNIMNSSAQIKDKELWILVLFLLIILAKRSLLTLEYAPCVCFFRKLWVWEKIRSKFLKAWEMKNLPWDR